MLSCNSEDSCKTFADRMLYHLQRDVMWLCNLRTKTLA